MNIYLDSDDLDPNQLPCAILFLNVVASEWRSTIGSPKTIDELIKRIQKANFKAGCMAPSDAGDSTAGSTGKDKQHGQYSDIAALLAEALGQGQDVASISTADASLVDGLIKDGSVKVDITAEQMVKLQNCIRHGKGALGANQAIVINFIARVEQDFNHQLTRALVVKLATLDMTTGLEALLLGLLRRTCPKEKISIFHMTAIAAKLQMFSKVTNMGFFDNAPDLIIEITTTIEKSLNDGATLNMGSVFSDVFTKSVGKSVNDIRKEISKGNMKFESVGKISSNAKDDLAAAIISANTMERSTYTPVYPKRLREEPGRGGASSDTGVASTEAAKTLKLKPCFEFKGGSGTCARGESCRFGHFNEKCRDFSVGKCVRGEKCHFAHE